MKNYSEKIDKIFGASNYQHRTLRTIFDPYSSEWNDTTMEQKVEILKKIINSEESIDKIIMGYQLYYKMENKNHVADTAYTGLLPIITYLLSDK